MFMDKTTFLTKYPQFASGMHVYGKDNELLGRIIAFSDNSMTIEKGVFFPKDFTLRYDEVEDIKDDRIYVARSLSELNEWKDESYRGWDNVEDINVGKVQPVPSEQYRQRFEALPEETVSVPLFEEELEAKKVRRQKGEVRVRKIVHTELKHMTVPVDHEKVRIERLDVNRRNANEAEAKEAFTEDTISMPVMDEDIEITKHAVRKGEVQLKKEHTVEKREISEKIRSEDVEIQDQQEQRQEQPDQLQQDQFKKKAG